MIIIQPYRGYLGEESVFIKGRVLKDRGIRRGQIGTAWKNMGDTIKRFGSDEIPGSRVECRFMDRSFEVISDVEGYFTIDEPFNGTPHDAHQHWIPAEFKLLEEGKRYSDKTFTGQILQPSSKAAFGVISDIDDTVLRTDVASLLKVKMLLNTMLKSAWQRVSIPGMVDVMKYLCWRDQETENPIWYVSNSPWNMYDVLADFIEIQGLPRGPVLLRDYGLHLLRKKEFRRRHKMQAILHIMESFPRLPFILIGDATSDDADFYLHTASLRPKQVKAIYIRECGSPRNVRRIISMFKQHPDIRTLLFKEPRDIIRDVSNTFWL